MRFLALAALILARAAPSQHRTADVIYLKQGGCAFTMDVFSPKTSNHKAIVFIVSSGWVSSHEGISPYVATPFTDNGFTVFEVVHGSQPKYAIPEIVPQLRHAIRFIRANAGIFDIDPNAIGVTGASAGGHLSLEVAGLGDDGDPKAADPVDRVSSRVQAVVAFMPPTDFRNWGSLGAMPFDLPALRALDPAWGITAQTTEAEKRQIAYALSPVLLVKSGFPPTLLVHGDADSVVPVQQSQEMDGVLSQSKVEHKLILIPAGGHDLQTALKAYPQAIDWFTRHLP